MGEEARWPPVALGAVEPPVALSIAGSDSGGCAGIQADLRTFAALGVHGCTAITAVTAQNTLGVDKVEVLSPSVVVAQVDAVTADLRPAATKTGMLATAEIVRAVAERAARGDLGPLVVDPVIVATSGDQLLEPSAVVAYRDELLPKAELITPNLPEAAALLGWDGAHLEDEGIETAAAALLALGCRAVLLKGGHDGDPERSADLFATPAGTTWLEARRVDTSNDHGTGCTLSAAVAAGLAKGAPLADAVQAAKDFIQRALEGAAAWRLGAGHGPVDHLGWGTRS